MVNCQLCNRKAEAKGFCKYHKVAYETLKQNYDIWCNAYGKLSWEEYLERLLKSKETGSWIKDVINLELKEKRGA
ncbi:MAG: hypothetical protein ACRD32_00350 [Nitrososphaerales archaeon]